MTDTATDAPVLKTGQEWSREDPEYEVRDSDGWDRRDIGENGVYFYETPITHEDYLRRRDLSTIRPRKPGELDASK